MSQSASPHASVADRERFLLCSCQGGAEAVLRQRAGEVFPGARPGAWRRGVVSFRISEGDAAAAAGGFDLVFARAVIQSVGQVTGDTDAARLAAACSLASGRAYDNVHVWQRDPRGELPVAEIRAGLLAAQGLSPEIPSVAIPGTVVLDCLLDSAERWWVGWHRCEDMPSRWPGGLYPRANEPLPETCVSRAWLKLDEAITVFGIPFQPGQRALELGAAPGGACQRLLEAGLEVVGVDPAIMDQRVVDAPRFAQWRMRAREVPLRRCVGVDWLLTDMNIDPTSTMAALARIASAPAVRLQGIVATLKLPDWSRAAELPGWLDTFRSCGLEPRARQLSTGGREVCVVAVRPERGVRSPTAVRTGSRSASGSVTRRRARRRPGR
jgi:23S rRNA (cytidine2498-2'-O)-methyltransferase